MDKPRSQIVIGYCRVSTAEQEQGGISLEQQRSAIEAWAKMKGFPVAAIYSDAKSGTRADNRPEFQKALRHVCEARGVLVFQEFDRAFRSMRDAVAVSEQIQQAGANMASLKEAIDTTSPMGEFMFHIIAAFGQFVQRTISAKTKATISYLKSRQLQSGTIPYGWQGDPEVLKIPREERKERKIRVPLVRCEGEQAIIAQIGALREHGTGYRAIARALNQQGSRTRSGGEWYPMTVKLVAQRGTELTHEE